MLTSIVYFLLCVGLVVASVLQLQQAPQISWCCCAPQRWCCASLSTRGLSSAQQRSSMATKGASLAGRLFEKYFYDFSLHKMYFKDMPYQKYVALRHNATLVIGFYFLMTAPFPFKPAFPMMGLCPRGYEGTFVCESDRAKALDMYKEWKYGKKE